MPCYFFIQIDFKNIFVLDNIKLDDSQGLRDKLSNDILQVPLFDLVRCKEFRHGKCFDVNDDHDVIYFPLNDEEKLLLQQIIYTKVTAINTVLILILILLQQN